MLAVIRRIAHRIRWGNDITVEIRAHYGETIWIIRSWKIYRTPDGPRRLNRVVTNGSIPLPATDGSGGVLPVVDHSEAVK
jgi:hypothetical protein